MPEIIRPDWDDLQEVVDAASTRLIVCSPFYSAEGVGRVFDNLNEGISMHFWTRLSPPDWAARVSDPDQLLTLLEVLNDGGIEVELGIFNRLHAKAYAADQVLALIGSQNLSENGFGANLEVAVRFREEEAANAIDALEDICVPNLRPVTLEELRTWVEDSSPTIEEARRVAVEQSEILAPVQAALDEILNFGETGTSGILEPDHGDMEDFVGWLEVNDDLAGADVLLRRHYNTDGQNLTGHFRQSFFASMRFLSEHPGLREPLAEELDHLNQDDLYQMDTLNVPELWIDHLDAHARDSSDYYSYPTLRGILPPALGGTRLGGGGGSSTIKRMLPLVARFIVENER